MPTHKIPFKAVNLQDHIFTPLSYHSPDRPSLQEATLYNTRPTIMSERPRPGRCHQW